MSGKSNADLLERRAAAVPQGPFNVAPYFAQSAKGSRITDVEGQEYIDFSGGIGVLNTGHCHPEVVRAIQEQAARYIHTCFHVLMYEPYIELAEKICGLLPGDFDRMALLLNSGAEAVENAVKAARYFTGRPAVVAFENGFHGRTLMAMSLTSKVDPYKKGFGPYAPEVYHIPGAYCYRCPVGLSYPGCEAACADLLSEAFSSRVAADQVAAVIAEPIQGEGGFITPPPEYFPKLKSICEKHGIIFIADEVQSGIGRTGKMFAMEHWGVTPDLTTTAKSLAAGLPLSGVAGRADILNSVHVGGLGGTYGGNPVCCAAALAVLEVMARERLVERSKELGKKMRDRFKEWQKEFQIIGEVRGLGSMLALELVEDRESREPAAEAAKKLITYAHQNGLILLSCGHFGNVIRILQPLNIDEATLEKGLGSWRMG